MEKCAQSGKDAPICNQGHEAGNTINLNVANNIFDEKKKINLIVRKCKTIGQISMTKPTTVVVCSEGWGVVFVPGVVVVVLFGGRGAGVTWVTILVLSKNVFINIKIGQIFAPGQNIWIDFMNST